ncbi:MAG: hypothetical protein AAGF11_44285 [Myxococcota bacterium]
MPRLTPCPSCHSHVMASDRTCPHCGATLRTVTAARASAVLLGLALAGCPGDDEGTSSEPDYGVPDTGTMTMDGTSTSDGSSSDTGSTTAGEAEYGVAETGSTSIEPEYGVPETTTGASTSAGEPDYGVPETTSG